MADLVNLNAESGRNIIGDDSTPTLTLENTSSGNALQLQNAGGTGVALSIVSTPTTALFANVVGTAGHFRSNASLQPAVIADQGVISSPTVAVVRLTQSAASGAFFELRGFLASIASATSITRGIRVKFGDSYGWIPIYESATYI